MSIDRTGLRWLSDLVAAIYGARTPDQLGAAAVELSHVKFRGTVTACEEVALDFSAYALHGARVEVNLPPNYAVWLHDHPAVVALKGGARPSAIHIMNGASRAYERADFFNALYRRIGARDNLAGLGYCSNRAFTLTVLRDHTFSPDESTLMRLVGPHLHAAWNRVCPRNPEPPAAPTITLAPGLRPKDIAPRQRSLLHAYFPEWRGPPSLPGRLRDWVRRSLAELSEPSPAKPLRAFVIDSARGHLLVRLFPADTGESIQLRLVESLLPPDASDFCPFGLTTREREVLHWIAVGKRNPEIAIIMRIAPATVRKHAERIFNKLGVRNRTAAVAALRSGPR